MKPTVILWDIDGTLISAGGVGRKALDGAFRATLGVPATFDFSFAGMTDPAIIRGGLRGTGREPSREALARLTEAYIEILAEEVARTDRYVVHGGVIQALDSLHGHRLASVGLGTGNIEKGARVKLDRAQLNRYFSFGGFGCDHEERAELIAVGARRGAERLGRPLSECRLIVIGDTVKDAAAAHANGGECLAVTTGGDDRAKLEAAGAQWVVDDLATINLPHLLELPPP